MLIFVSGHYPILGSQMLYFLDPELARRAAIAPAQPLHRIEKGKVVLRDPDLAAGEVINKPELVMDGEIGSEFEREFVEKFQACESNSN